MFHPNQIPMSYSLQRMMHLKLAVTTLWLITLVQNSKIPATSHKIDSRLKVTQEEKEVIVKELENAQMLKELEVLIKNLDDDQLDNLEKILVEDEEDSEDTEFGRVKQELLDMGMEEQDIEDLKTLAALMVEFLEKIPNIERKLELKAEADLLDNVQVISLNQNYTVFRITNRIILVVSAWAA